MLYDLGNGIKGYLYETHSHTVQASACGRVSGEEYIDYMMAHGFSGMIITDHFFNGNSCVPQGLPWNERVEWYASGYRRAFRAAEDRDFDVLFGVEFNFDGDEYLLYGVDVQWLLDNDDLLDLTRQEVYKRVHEAGAVMIQAHPYRERPYLSDIRLTPSVCDAAEIYNAANPDYQNALGYAYAKELGVPMTAGSDIHFFYDGPMGGMLLPKRIKTPSEYASYVMNREAIPVMLEKGRVTPVTEIPALTVPTIKPTLPVLHL